MKSLFFFLIFSLSFSSIADPWILEEGDWNLRLDYVKNKFDKVRFDDSRKRDIGQVSGYTSSLSLNHGIWEDIEVGINVAYKSINQNGTGSDRNRSFSDIILSSKFRLIDEFDDKPVTLTLGIDYKLPVRSYEAHTLYATGDGQNDLFFYLALGKYHVIDENWAVFGAINLGYKFRFEEAPDDLIIKASTGFTYKDFSLYTYLERFDARGGVGLNSTKFLAEAAIDGRPPFPKVAEDYVVGGIGIGYSISESVSLEFSWAKVLWYRNSSEDSQFGFAINYSF